jgi:hypothetical protein
MTPTPRYLRGPNLRELCHNYLYGMLRLSGVLPPDYNDEVFYIAEDVSSYVTALENALEDCLLEYDEEPLLRYLREKGSYGMQ